MGKLAEDRQPRDKADSRNRKNDLTEFTSRLRTEVQAMQTGFRAMRAAMDITRQEELQEFLDSLRQTVIAIKKDTAAMLNNAHNNRKEMSAQIRNELSAFRAALNKSVADLREKVAAASTAGDGSWDEEEAVEPGQPADRAAETIRPEDRKPVQHDLTRIAGIGPVTQERLYDIGIDTFTKLAFSQAQDLRQKLGLRLRVAEIDKWIKQAGEILEKERI